METYQTIIARRLAEANLAHQSTLVAKERAWRNRESDVELELIQRERSTAYGRWDALNELHRELTQLIDA